VQGICPLGAAALAGTPVPIDRRQPPPKLGFESLLRPTASTRSGDRDFAVEFSDRRQPDPWCTSAAWLKE